MLPDVSQISLFGFESQIWTVSDLNRHIRLLLESDYRLQDLWVAGEVSNVSYPSSGHLYFTLKDAGGALRGVMWRPDVSRLGAIPAEGEAVEVHGHVSVYEQGGQYQLYADQLRPAGEGALYQEFARLKARLEAEGLFAAERKRPLPDWPHRIGVVTSPSAAALQDVLNVLRRRFPLAEVILSPTPVQGEEAARGIIAALEALNHAAHPDVILLVRGGGSIEDLWAFNQEAVARAIAASQAPVVSGVGHEIDFTIADFVADRRAPTPSAAAEIATPDAAQLLSRVTELQLASGRRFASQLRESRQALDQETIALRRNSPRARIESGLQRVDELRRRSRAALRSGLALHREGLRRLTQTLHAVGPRAVLTRGYAVVQRSDDGSVIRSAGQVSLGDGIDVLVSDGKFQATVSDTEAA
jgi:exodeoxyribonuclease VII large subunit